MKQLRHFLATTFLFLAVKCEPEWVKFLMVHNEEQPTPPVEPVVTPEGGEVSGA